VSEPDAVHRRDEAPEWLAWSWPDRRQRFPWLGVLLVIIGIGLLVQYFVPTVSVGTIVLLAIGIAFLAGWLLGGSWFSMVPGVLISGLAAGGLVNELGVYSGPGLTALALATGFIVIWLLAFATDRRYTWALWGAAIFGLIGLVQVSGRITGMQESGLFWPVVIIVIGLLLVLSARRR
jgi:hypothetical protein